VKATFYSRIPILNPVRVAEEFALLDNLSGGRVVAGLLRGIPTEYLTYGTNPDESRARFEEALQVIIRARTAS
jgi:alkanesulfonate monooxygenase SsuD/methylene tetrahydromethanopterin reductase-like flavin-dependent oxidoreductase (luciferase family)